MFSPLNFPHADLRIRIYEGQRQVFDMIRKIHVILTPEEWVRQHVIHFLIFEKGFPKGLIEVEKNIKLFNTEKRVDILVRTRDLKPLLLVECKAPDIKLKQNETNQIARYQITLNAPYCFLTNGTQHFVMEYKGEKTGFLKDLPEYKDMMPPPFN